LQWACQLPKHVPGAPKSRGFPRFARSVAPVTADDRRNRPQITAVRCRLQRPGPQSVAGPRGRAGRGDGVPEGRLGYSSVPSIASSAMSVRPASSPAQPPDFDAVVIGAGVAGLCVLYRLDELGLSLRCYEAASDVGGVWYWNRYPGARFDSESYTYCYSFSQALLDDWNWRERFAAQPEILAYLNHVADRFDLRRHIRFDTRVAFARFEASDRRWVIGTEDGEAVTARYLITALGGLSTPQLPDIAGVDDFAGEACHTARWPRAGVDLSGKRVGVIGTGATGVQVIQTIADQVAHLTVFQRTPNYCIPQRNSALSEEEMRGIKRSYPAIFERCLRSYGGFIHVFDPRSGLAVSAAEREATFETLWKEPGFAFWFGNFMDLLMDETVNGYASEVLRARIRESRNVSGAGYHYSLPS
jgi:cation diffusion facilitator CzcD-associated flavoprotein CzcO